jgi:hypothetical protein
MYNFSKLSQASQLFVTGLKPGDVSNIAAAKAIANALPLPSFVVSSLQEQFNTTCRDQANMLTSALNEVAVIKYSEVIELVRSFWSMRYNAVHPQEHLTFKDGDAIACFMGVAQSIPANVCKTICDNQCDVIDALNGFARILRELNVPAQPDEVNMSTAPQMVQRTL